MKEYEINEDTMAIIPINYYQTLVKEMDNEYIIDKRAYEVMEDSCEYYGSTYKGRLAAAKKMLNSSYKIPIIIEESENIKQAEGHEKSPFLALPPYQPLQPGLPEETMPPPPPPLRTASPLCSKI